MRKVMHEVMHEVMHTGMHKRISRRTGASLVTCLLAALALIGAAPVARAGGGCSEKKPDKGCDHQDPMTTGCYQDAQTVRSASIKDPAGSVIGLEELRWSETCGTNWARTTIYSGSYVVRTAVARAPDYYANKDDVDEITARAEGKSVMWSGMLFARDICTKARGVMDTEGTGAFVAETDAAC